jgi:magnesium chelatase family protein
LKSAIRQARAIQQARFRRAGLKKLTNAELSSRECEELIKLDAEAHNLIKKIFNQSLLSTRGYYRLLKTSQTIADLEASEKVLPAHVAEAFQLRMRED